MLEPVNITRALAEQTINYERDYQELLHMGNTASSPHIELGTKIHWITEEYLETITAFNDGEPDRKTMHEIVQVAALCKATIEWFISHRDPLFPVYVARQREEDLAAKKSA